MSEEKDWLVIVNLMAGSGSWARGSDREATIKRAKAITKADWKSLFSFKKGTVIKANVLDVTGYDHVVWGDSVTVDGKPYKGKIEMVELVY